MTPARQLQLASAVAVAGALVLLSVFLGSAVALLWSSWGQSERAAALALLQGRGGLVMVAVLVLLLFAGAAAHPLLRRWVSRLRQLGVTFHMRHRWQGPHGDDPLRLVFDTPHGTQVVRTRATVMAMGQVSRRDRNRYTGTAGTTGRVVPVT